MDDPGTLIYVAFLVISLIAGWLKNRKKAEAEKLDPISDEPQMTLSRSEIDEAVASQREERATAEEKLKLMSMESLKAQKRKESKTRRPITSENVVDDASADETAELSDSERFDARKAFIYSEILNPPHL